MAKFPKDAPKRRVVKALEGRQTWRAVCARPGTTLWTLWKRGWGVRTTRRSSKPLPMKVESS